MKPLFFALLCFATAAQATAPKIILSNHYNKQNITGWAMSEKMDGVRAYWDGKQLISRQGNVFTPPAGFTRDFPPFALDGELYAGRGTFERVSATVRSTQGNWQGIRLHVFDVPNAEGNLYQRLSLAKQHAAKHPNAQFVVVPQITVKDEAHARQFLRQIEQGGGEGVMLHNPNAPYTSGRSNDLLKLKTTHDAECTVTQHHQGKGKYADTLGAVSCKNELGEFRIGSGFKDKDRDNPPPIGSVITYKYRGFTAKGTPRFATFLRRRNEK
ncbi:DNA ligase [Kingella negevensis]|uniref:DNA ligase n=1 Tax=Kingella negevensis TaxID=1522312 RepID=A0A238HF41_9NEIS|nr:DNA ligase [Kingella negevensis]MDK4680071.1 DNA ligase [Kingella negevensis]MDK4682209.1 DNA ligase [Kingella negevensis]MDK4690406.1 DNA ligase [Kingella negevensis]MDK4692245.1 DNA ligase [Kingella negevensis]MDK4696389.1 DNA ligase [Kingella negevensis]